MTKMKSYARKQKKDKEQVDAVDAVIDEVRQHGDSH